MSGVQVTPKALGQTLWKRKERTVTLHVVSCACDERPGRLRHGLLASVVYGTLVYHDCSGPTSASGVFKLYGQYKSAATNKSGY